MNTSQLVQQEMFLVAYQQHEKDLTGYAYCKVGDKTTSQDLVQTTFMKAWNYIRKGGRVDAMKSFLFHILNHLIIDEYRKHKLESLDVLIEKKVVEEPNNNPAHRLMDSLDGKAVFTLLVKLPEKFKKVIEMRFLEDLSLKEISRLTGQTKNAVAVQVHRGVKKLRAEYFQARQSMGADHTLSFK